MNSNRVPTPALPLFTVPTLPLQPFLLWMVREKPLLDSCGRFFLPSTHRSQLTSLSLCSPISPGAPPPLTPPALGSRTPTQSGTAQSSIRRCGGA